MGYYLFKRGAYIDFIYGSGVLTYALKRLPGMLNWHNAFGIGIIDENKILGCVVYDNYQPHLGNITLSSVVEDKRMLTKMTLRRLFHYPFVELNLNRVTCYVDGQNKKSLDACKRLGFVVEGVCRQAAMEKSDLVILGMLKSECKWL